MTPVLDSLALQELLEEMLRRSLESAAEQLSSQAVPAEEGS